jgi:hypothetical protein
MPLAVKMEKGRRARRLKDTRDEVRILLNKMDQPRRALLSLLVDSASNSGR